MIGFIFFYNEIVTVFYIFYSGSGAPGMGNSTFVLTNGACSLTRIIRTNKTYDQWFLDPQTVLLDINKGNRVRIINNSTKNLKLVLFWFPNTINIHCVLQRFLLLFRFKTSSDSRIINICPLSGTVPAMWVMTLSLL